MFSEETNNTVLEISDFSNGKLKNIFELSALIENSKRKEKLFGDIIFRAKYLYGIVNVLSDAANSDIVNDSLKSEFSSALLELKDLLSSYVSDIPEKEMFDKKFFGMSQECMNDFIGFVIDLSYTKEYFNDRKFSGNS